MRKNSYFPQRAGTPLGSVGSVGSASVGSVGSASVAASARASFVGVNPGTGGMVGGWGPATALAVATRPLDYTATDFVGVTRVICESGGQKSTIETVGPMGNLSGFIGRAGGAAVGMATLANTLANDAKRRRGGDDHLVVEAAEKDATIASQQTVIATLQATNASYFQEGTSLRTEHEALKGAYARVMASSADKDATIVGMTAEFEELQDELEAAKAEIQACHIALQMRPT
jgi:hypothetical protein